MKVTLDNIKYKGQFFKEVIVDIPQIEVLEDNDWIIQHYICKELDRRIRG